MVEGRLFAGCKKPRCSCLMTIVLTPMQTVWCGVCHKGKKQRKGNATNVERWVGVSGHAALRRAGCARQAGRQAGSEAAAVACVQEPKQARAVRAVMIMYNVCMQWSKRLCDNDDGGRSSCRVQAASCRPSRRAKRLRVAPFTFPGRAAAVATTTA
ncbi:uncharacterized protein J3D65DRAFT_76688 [Phyllosticta citribraziliensis]|uniref:Uncharacterized protein n=1 Tax=Phyllosticta citribraziliensis TaxID=989973 RepID=A0ABR1LF63_9PEZI